MIARKTKGRDIIRHGQRVLWQRGRHQGTYISKSSPISRPIPFLLSFLERHIYIYIDEYRDYRCILKNRSGGFGSKMSN